jgi:MOSC domain-containing protein YiiM
VPELVSVNVAEPRTLERNGELVRTGIWKFPVDGRVAVRGVNVEGDEQADRSAHGGRDKAVYAYAREDLDWWEGQLGRDLAHGTFGRTSPRAGSK